MRRRRPVEAVRGAVAALAAVERRPRNHGVAGDERSGLQRERGAEQAAADRLTAAAVTTRVEPRQHAARRQPTAGHVDRAPDQIGRRLPGAALAGFDAGRAPA